MTPGLNRELQLGAAVKEAEAVLPDSSPAEAARLSMTACETGRRATGRSEMDGGTGYRVPAVIRSHGSDVVISAGKERNNRHVGIVIYITPISLLLIIFL